MTIAYKNNCPSFLDNVFGVDPSEVHIHVRRIPVKDIPASEVDSTAWLIDSFQLKDKLLSDFKIEGHFPDPVAEEQLSFIKCLANFILVIFLTAMFLYLTISSVWLKMYIVLSGSYLALATYLNIRPMPIIGHVRAMFCSKKTRND
ncbi:Acyltransferase, C-terminal domain containing protein [Parasponia andersonii]|uniref:1-acylglycerol-3-phosphate O-acyltransferase n=1 Tax=Parasponia andersonii TaxID=3476 RepID=A0A2P5AIU4_PARAD|nr:Acyltransferase, C-terminal domain containing protein [Parasponia andersonii]